ncbi:TPA: LOW QUALITY PROTEIN: hypothetical protein N0F65_002835 [Lagenidium giganteum]|uniref:Uncharacterized protein n=1 Tax=Lagenidium giganteum TaxID=4803 RepID=A0AAV2Z9J9_9STRA|nr:TPA: LOW QUALITY PROTEIN: hypothetical protein N0F65_002835 [Lagenidium giganteum]
MKLHLHIMHKNVDEQREKQTSRNKHKHKLEVKANFDVGDYVFGSRMYQQANDKLLVTSIGPYHSVSVTW